MKIDRLISILMILLERKRISAEKLSEMFEVSKRTIYRDIEAISMAGIPIRTTSGAGGGIEIMSQYKIGSNVFSEDDLSVLLMGLTNLSKIAQGSEVRNAIAKVRSFIPQEQAKSIEIKANQVLIDLNPWFGSGNVNQHLEIIKSALQENALISFTYIDVHSNRSRRIAEPYQLVLKGHAWYVQSFCRTKSDYRLFRLSRMTELEMLDEKFIPRDYQKPVLDFEEAVEKLQTDIRLRVHRSILDRILEFCAFERIKPDGEDYYLVEYPFIERDYYYDMLLSFGDKCECLEPAYVREELKRRIARLSQLYGGS